jgi:hypothetical protein
MKALIASNPPAITGACLQQIIQAAAYPDVIASAATSLRAPEKLRREQSLLASRDRFTCQIGRIGVHGIRTLPLNFPHRRSEWRIEHY